MTQVLGKPERCMLAFTTVVLLMSIGLWVSLFAVYNHQVGECCENEQVTDIFTGDIASCVSSDRIGSKCKDRAHALVYTQYVLVGVVCLTIVLTYLFLPPSAFYALMGVSATCAALYFVGFNMLYISGSIACFPKGYKLHQNFPKNNHACIYEYTPEERWRKGFKNVFKVRDEAAEIALISISIASFIFITGVSALLVFACRPCRPKKIAKKMAQTITTVSRSFKGYASVSQTSPSDDTQYVPPLYMESDEGGHTSEPLTQETSFAADTELDENGTPNTKTLFSRNEEESPLGDQEPL
jgi:hypothetical protein